MTSTYMSTEATLHSIFELFPPEVLRSHSCLHFQGLYVLLRDILHKVGIVVERRRALYILQAIVDKIYESDNTKRSTGSSFFAEFKHAAT